MSAPRRHLGAGAALSVAAQGGPLLAGAVLSIVVARTIGPSGNGRYVPLLTLVGLTSMIVSLGLHAGITYEVKHHSIFGAIATSEPRAKALCQKRLTKLAPATPC